MSKHPIEGWLHRHYRLEAFLDEKFPDQSHSHTVVDTDGITQIYHEMFSLQQELSAVRAELVEATEALLLVLEEMELEILDEPTINDGSWDAYNKSKSIIEKYFGYYKPFMKEKEDK